MCYLCVSRARAPRVVERHLRNCVHFAFHTLQWTQTGWSQPGTAQLVPTELLLALKLDSHAMPASALLVALATTRNFHVACLQYRITRTSTLRTWKHRNETSWTACLTAV